MRCICAQIGEKGCVIFPLIIHPVNCSVEKEVGAIAFGLNEFSVVTDDWIEIFITRNVRTRTRKCLSDTASAVDENLIKTPTPRLICVFVSEVPFPEDSGGLSGLFENFG